ncbi:protein BatA [Oceaniferula spumae]|uniref:Protein BatA n=1 Tax=Oceaniferula spumae TaxID=2979115 RepID=A0AAT9FJ02_9BACT
MTFAYPYVLLALALPILLIVFQWRHHAKPLALPFDHQDTDHAKWLARLLNLVNTLPALVLAVAVLLAAGPRRFERPKSEREMTNIQFCLDVSGSMMAQFGGSDRYEVAMDSLNEFLTYRKGDSFSLMVFGGHQLRWVPLTTDVSAFRSAPPFLRPDKLPPWFSGGTFIGKALKQSEKYLTTAEKGDRMIILLSDGESFDLYDGNDVKIAQSLKDNKITVYTVHIGGGAAPPEVSVISSITGGETFAAGDPAALKSVFLRIDEMQQAEMKRLTPDPVDYYQPFVITAISLSGIYLLTLFGLRYTPW